MELTEQFRKVSEAVSPKTTPRSSEAILLRWIRFRLRLREAAALARYTADVAGGHDLSLVGRRLQSYHAPPNDAVLDASRAELGPLGAAERDAFLLRACELLLRRGFASGHLPPRLGAWLRGPGGRQFVEDQRAILQGLETADTHAREMAWLVRVVQLQLREKAPQVLGKDVGADELTPLLEEIVVAARPQHGWSVAGAMQGLDTHALLLQPNLAAAVDGWEVALSGIEGCALDCWRRATGEAAVWAALVVHARKAEADSGGLARQLLEDDSAPLTTLAEALLRRAAQEERTAWELAPPGRYLEVLQRSVDALFDDPVEASCDDTAEASSAAAAPDGQAKEAAKDALEEPWVPKCSEQYRVVGVELHDR